MERKNILNNNEFTVYSPTIINNSQISEDQVANQFDCYGKNISPKVVWKNVPKETKSFAITLYDNDAKTDSGWWHWVVYNIPSDIDSIENGASSNKELMPKGSIQVLNDYSSYGFGGICQPKGSKYNYTLTVYALNNEIDLPKNSTPAMVRLYINKYLIDKAEIKAFYIRDIDINKNNIYKFKSNSSKKFILKEEK